MTNYQLLGANVNRFFQAEDMFLFIQIKPNMFIKYHDLGPGIVVNISSGKALLKFGHIL